MKVELKNLFNLKNKIIVITGACGLLGKQHSEVIAAFGGIPILLDLNKNEVHHFTKYLNKKYSINTSGYCLDITKEDDVKMNSNIILSKYGKIDGLINNAANNPKIEDNDDIAFSRLENFTFENWYNDLSVGLTGAFLCSKYYGEQISLNKNGGSIINVSSDLGIISPDQRLYKIKGVTEEMQPVKPISYSVVKSGLIGLTKYLATYWADKNVRCNAICPGGVENGQDRNFIKLLSSRIPLNRLAKVNDYQSTIIWMLSNNSSYLNGSIISIDGGRTTW